MSVSELDVGILYNQSNITTVYVNEGSNLPEPLFCGVSPDTTGYNDVLQLNWKRDDGTSIPTSTKRIKGIVQVAEGQQRLYVKKMSAARRNHSSSSHAALPQTRG